MWVKYTCEYEILYEIDEEDWDAGSEQLLNLTQAACYPPDRRFLGKRPHFLKDFKFRIVRLENWGELEDDDR